MKIDGREIEAAFIGDRPPSLVFLHEGLGSVAQWRDFPLRVAEATNRGALVYSRFGYGASDSIELPRPLDYMNREGEEIVPRVLDAAAVREAILVGHSDGASIAIVAAAIDPRVRAIVLEAPHVFAEDLSVASIEKARDAYEHGDLREKLARYHRHVDAAFYGWNRAWLDPEFRKWTLAPYLPRVRVPVLVVQGEDDPYGTRAQVDAVAQGCAGRVETLMLPRCGHAPHRDAADATLDAIVRFVRSV